MVADLSGFAGGDHKATRSPSTNHIYQSAWRHWETENRTGNSRGRNYSATARVVGSTMELRNNERPEPSHIHVPRPSHIERGLLQLQSSCPADICPQLAEQPKDRTFADCD